MRIFPAISAAILVSVMAASAVVRGLAQVSTAGTGKLIYIALLNRHGVRTPLNTNASLNAYSAEPWPAWDVPLGALTKQGAALMKIVGTYDREYLIQNELLSAKGCSDAAHFYFWSDTTQRDIDSGQAVAEGMLPGCAVDVHSVSQGRDPLFTPLASGIGKPDPSVAAAAISGRIGGDPRDLTDAYRSELETMQQVLGKSAARSIFDLPAAVQSTATSAQLNGPLSLAGAVSENFMLEYTTGMKDEDVGWGRVTKESIRSMLLLQEAYNDIALRTPYIARTNGSNLLSHMYRSMQQAVEGKAVPGSLGKAGDKGLFVFGHDSDMSYFGGMLGISWLLPDYQPNSRPPGSALVFEIWQDAGGKKSVRTYVTSQSLDQMRFVTPLSLQTPPERVPIFIPGCSKSAEGFPCDWETFQHTVENAFDPAFVSP